MNREKPLYAKLYDWQKQIIDAYKDRKAFGLFLDMGLGKTLLSLAFAEAMEADKILIVTINKKALEGEDVEGSFLFWAKQMERSYAFHDKRCSFRGEGAKKWRREISPDTKDLLILNYEALYKAGQSIEIRDRQHKRCVLTDIVSDFVASCEDKKVAVIVDESHRVKELRSLQTQALQKIVRELSFRKCDVRTYLLTGTPFTKGLEDLYSQLKFLGWEGTKSAFEDRFCVRGCIRGLLEWQQPIVAYKNVDELYELVHRYAITIKSDAVVKLPEQVFSYHKTPCSEEMLLLTCETMKKERIESFAKKRGIALPFDLAKAPMGGRVNNPFYRNIAFPDMSWLAETPGSFWMRSRQMSVGFQGNEESFEWYCKDRLAAFEKLLAENEDNYVVFYNYEPELFALFDICDKLGYKVDVCSGNIKTEHFYSKYASQREGERMLNKKNVILANFKSGSAGSNWQLYDKCVIFSIPGFGDWQQALKRVHRIGQKNTVIYHVFCSDNWLDMSMLKALRESKEYDKSMFLTDLSRVKHLMASR